MRQAARIRERTVAAGPEATRTGRNRTKPDLGAPTTHGDAGRPITRPVGEVNRNSFPSRTPPCRIYRPSPSVMQAGRANARSWVLEFEPSGHRWIEPLMGWSASDDPFSVVRLTFPTLAAAVDYAEQEGLDYRVIEPPAKRLVPKDYREAIAGPAFRNRGSGQLEAGRSLTKSAAPVSRTTQKAA
jgi:hypothetical protein